MRRLLAIAVLLALTSACSADETPPAGPAPVTTTSSAAPAPTVAGNGEDARLCKLVGDATAGGDVDQLVNTGMAADILEASEGASVAELKSGAQNLWDRQQAAVALADAEDAATAEETLLATAMRLRVACQTTGLINS